MQRWQCRVASSLGGGFAGDVYSAWGVHPYTDDTSPTVFFGMYGLPDFYALWRHKGKKAILWAGSDITHIKNGYWLDDVGEIRMDKNSLCEWINQNCDSYVENDVEKDALWCLGVKPVAVIPSFLGNVDDYKIEYKHNPVKLYTSVSGDDFALYGWHKIPPLAKMNPDVEFHLYGNTKEWTCMEKNVLIHGRIPQEEMNAQIKKMTGALRLTTFDGFSEIIAKSLLWGQYPVSIISYPYTVEPQDFDLLWENKYPNKEGRAWVLNSVNKYPWNKYV